MEACPKTELIAVEDPATVCDGSLAIGEGREAQMIRHMRHGSPPRLMAPQPTLSLPSAPTVGNPLRPLQPETVSLDLNHRAAGDRVVLDDAVDREHRRIALFRDEM